MDDLTFSEFELVLQTLESDRHMVYGFFMEDHYRRDGHSLIEKGILMEGALNMVVPDRWDDEMDSREVEWNPETRTYQYWTSHGGGWVDAPEADMKTYDLDMDRALGHLAGLAGLDESTKPREIIPNLLWELGSVWSGQRKATVFYGRKLSFMTNFDKIYDGLSNWAGKAAGVILSETAPQSRHIELPGKHRILSLEKAIVELSDGYELDMELFYGALGLDSPSEESSPIIHNVDFSSITVNGREFVFTGGKQKQVLEILCQQWKMGNPRCRTGVILEEIESTAQAISQLFNRHPDWRDLIDYGGGYCWLKV
ncbi:MAG: hypothetical protein HQL72_03620 [Magnetococcales bacterium]|nr:hypothetical protein [Magnetococcales bacterium]